MNRLQFQHFALGGRRFVGIKFGSWKLMLRPSVALIRAQSRFRETPRERAARDAGLNVARLRTALTLDWTPFWRETPIEEADGVHGMSTAFDLVAFTDAVAAEYARLADDGAPFPAGVNRADSEGER